MLLLSHAVAGKITTPRTAPLRISCRAARRKQRDLRNHGSLKPREVGSPKRGSKEDEIFKASL